MKEPASVRPPNLPPGLEKYGVPALVSNCVDASNAQVIEHKPDHTRLVQDIPIAQSCDAKDICQK